MPLWLTRVKRTVNGVFSSDAVWLPLADRVLLAGIGDLRPHHILVVAESEDGRVFAVGREDRRVRKFAITRRTVERAAVLGGEAAGPCGRGGLSLSDKSMVIGVP